MAEVGEVVDGRYELEAVIGKGGMGAVFRARHVFTHQRVALKLITDTLDADSGTRFLAEARAASTIGHPAIVHVSDANRTPDGRLYLVMELLAGKPLRLAMQQPADQIRRIGLELLDALSAAHVRGVIHRDLKPENIFLVAPTGAVKVLDFGIAKVKGAGPTTHGHTLGTLEYMAPEQLYDSSQVTNRADLWAIGVILYELIAGVRPFAGTTREEKFHALAKDEPMPIESIVPVTPDVAAFFQRALAREPDQRFQAASQMADALRTLRFGAPVAAIGTSAGGSTLGTGAQWAHPPANNPNPTLGTGSGWVRPPADNPNPTLATGDGWRKPPSIPPPDDRSAGASRATPGSIPPQDAYGPGAIPPPTADGTGTQPGAFRPPDPTQPQAPARPSSRRGVLFGAIGIVVVAGAIAFGVVAGSRDKATGGGSAAPTGSRCETACKKLGQCDLEQTTCVADCERKMVMVDCVEAAASCTDQATCVWKWTCVEPKGDLTCAESLGCIARCGTKGTPCQCSCNAQMNPKASLLMAKLFTCRQNAGEDLDKFGRECMQYTLDCQGDLPVHDVPVATSCKQLCKDAAACDMAMPSCELDCQANRIDQECLAAAKTCDDHAKCYLQKTCGRPVKFGGVGCGDSMSCVSKLADKDTSLRCDVCFDLMTPKAASDYARFQICTAGLQQKLLKDPQHRDDYLKAWNERCQKFSATCFGVKP